MAMAGPLPSPAQPPPPRATGVVGAHASAPGATLAAVLLFAPLFVTVFLAKIGTVVGPPDLGLPVPLLALITLAAVATGRARFDRRLLLVYLCVVSSLGLMQLIAADRFSPTSFLLMLTLYFAYTMRIPGPGLDTRAALSALSGITVLIAVLGLIQFFGQFVVDRTLLFPMENLLPPQLLITGYNTQIPLYYGATTYKANGVFPLEPSFFSQLLAIGLVAELVSRNRMWRIALLGAAIMVSYSGTGLMVLSVCLPLLVIARRRWDLIALALIVAACLPLFSDKLSLDVFLQRATEFTDRRSSGFERFVGGFYMFDRFLWPDPLKALFGAGAGTFMDYAIRAEYAAAEIALFKVVFEFGLLGSMMHLGFLLYAVSRSKAPPLLRLAVGISFFLNGIYNATSHGLALTLLAWPAPTDGERPLSDRTAPS